MNSIIHMDTHVLEKHSHDGFLIFMISTVLSSRHVRPGWTAGKSNIWRSPSGYLTFKTHGDYWGSFPEF